MYKILSLDGGGLKGLYTIEMLIKIKNSYGIKFHEYFDLIIGTSTGSIIATMLALGKEPEEILVEYNKFYEDIFTATNNNGFLKSRYENVKLEEVVKEYLKEYSYEDLQTELIIPTVDLSNSTICLIKSTDQIEKPVESRFYLADAVISSCAAPGFFKPHIIEKSIYVDGSIYANNPSMVGLSEAFKKGYTNIEDIKILSLGTGYNEQKYEVDDVSNKKLMSAYSNKMIDRMLYKMFNITEDDIGLISISSALIKTSMKTSIELNEYILDSMYKQTSNYVRINDKSSEVLELDKVPTQLINNIDKLYNNYHIKKLDKFFNRNQLPKVKKYNWWQKFFVNISEKLYNIANK